MKSDTGIPKGSISGKTSVSLFSRKLRFGKLPEGHFLKVKVVH